MASLKTQWLFFILLFGSLHTWAACPSLVGTYRIEAGDNTQQLVIQQDKKLYSVSIVDTAGNKEVLTVIDVPKEEIKKEEPLLKCAILVQGLGIIKKVDKGAEFNVTAESQNYLNKRIASTGYIIYIASGFYSEIINLEKLN